MDRLNDLPTKDDTHLSPQEEEVMNQLFPGESPKGYPQGNPPSRGPPPQANMREDYDDEYDDKPTKGKVNWKMIGYAAIIFALLANPWTDSAVEKLPYAGSNTAMKLVTKVLMFVLLLTLVSMFVV